MTVQDFKEKHPHLSHLEGNNLWDAMEDALIYERKAEKPKVITDYLGNEVKYGMSICFVKVVDKDYFGNASLLVPQMNGGHKVIEVSKRKPDAPCWEVGSYIDVELGLNYTKQIGEYTFTAPLSMLIFGTDFSTHILSIKGVSDTKEQYNEFLKKGK